MNRTPTLERAYQIARAGRCAGIGDIRKELVGEGYMDVPQQLYGPMLAKDLNRLCKAARTA